MANNARDINVEQHLKEMNQRIEALQNQASTWDEGHGFNINPTFTTRIMQESIPMNFKVPHLESYDGLGDSLDHLKSFQTLMLL